MVVSFHKEDFSQALDDTITTLCNTFNVLKKLNDINTLNILMYSHSSLKTYSKIH